MLVSALLTSVGINLVLCILFFTLYSILRKQPINVDVYVPRLVAEGKYKKKSHFDLERLLPTPGWLRNAWIPSEEELLLSSGLDAVVFMRLLIFCLRVFLFAGIVGIFVLLPLHCLGNQLEELDFDDLRNNSLDTFTISNVKNGSKWLWIHFVAVYLVTGWICCLLYYEYKYISSKRIACFFSSKPQPQQFTILVRSIPDSAGTSVSDCVESFFSELYPSTYLSHVVVHRTHKLQSLINRAEKMHKNILQIQSEPSGKCSGCCGLFRKKVDHVDYGKKLQAIEENVRLEQSEFSLAEQEIRAAFVSFKSRYAAAVALHLQQSVNPVQWVTEKAPEPHDVYWPFFSSSFMKRWISKLVVLVVCILLTILFLIPVLIVQGLTNLSNLEAWFPFLKSILSTKIVDQVVTGYLPSLILQLFLKLVPPIMVLLTSIQGYISLSEIGKSACNKVLWFTIWNIFFANVFSGTAFNQISIVLEPKDIPAMLAVDVPAQDPEYDAIDGMCEIFKGYIAHARIKPILQMLEGIRVILMERIVKKRKWFGNFDDDLYPKASFFIAYVVTSGWTSTSSELFRLFPLICSSIRKTFSKSTEDEVEVPSFPYHQDTPRVLFFALLGITYFFLAPLILPFLLIYFCLGYIIYRNQFINVYEPKYETWGKFWPIVHNSMIFSLVLMHAIAVGIFTLKKLPLASSLIFPLPVITLLFNEYCRKRFLPIFSEYSAESLLKKDREDERDGAMDEFFNNLVTAYKDPALSPIHYLANGNTHSTPLLSSSSQV